ncbi:outer membrane efflux protein [Lucifera butyrica]|uniref:Outer membrane efflux protein n=1 Tax=Lucifera butyrica TaxID=1351585 RepID=A0A498R2I5_9FIRM|nr:TolC family protein [Lucifera butyrica]VBB04980.1 outer membrane efflux protein [Lucifera butyrica]
MKPYYRACISFLLSACLFVLGHSVQAEARLTLPESISLAMKNNPAMQIAAANIEESKWSLKEAKAYNGVTFKYDFNYGRSDQAPSWYNNTTAQYPLPGVSFPAWSDTYTFYQHQFKLALPLYTGRKLESMADMAGRGQAAMEFAHNATKEQLALEVTTSYYNVLQALNLRNIARQAVDDFSGHLTNVQQQYDVGNVALSDVLQTEVRLANARNNLIKAQNAVKMARYKLNKVIGLNLTDDTELEDSVSHDPYTATLEDSLAEAFKSRPEIQQAKLKIAMAQDKIKIAQSDSLPAVGAFAVENISDTSPSTSKHNTDWTVGLNVSYDIFDNHITKNKVEQAKAGLTIATQQERQLEDAITLEVSNAFLNVKEAAERIKNNQVAVNQSEHDYAMAKERYFAGIGTNLDVMDAEVAMTQAKTNYVVAVYDYCNSIAQLKKAMGKIY